VRQGKNERESGLDGCRRYESKDGRGRTKQDARAETMSGTHCRVYTTVCRYAAPHYELIFNAVSPSTAILRQQEEDHEPQGKVCKIKQGS